MRSGQNGAKITGFSGTVYRPRKTKKDIVTQEAVDLLIISAKTDQIEQEIIEYGTSHPEAPFWDFLNFIKPGLKGITQEELLEEE